MNIDINRIIEKTKEREKKQQMCLTLNEDNIKWLRDNGSPSAIINIIIEQLREGAEK